MDRTQQSALWPRLAVIENLLLLLMDNMIVTSGEPPVEAVERLRVILWEMAPQMSATRPENEMQAFRKEFDKRLDVIFDGLATLAQSRALRS